MWVTKRVKSSVRKLNSYSELPAGPSCCSIAVSQWTSGFKAISKWLAISKSHCVFRIFTCIGQDSIRVWSSAFRKIGVIFRCLRSDRKDELVRTPATAIKKQLYHCLLRQLRASQLDSMLIVSICKCNVIFSADIFSQYLWITVPLIEKWRSCASCQQCS